MLEIWGWRRALRMPWTARKADEWVLDQTKRERSLDAIMVKLRLSYKTVPPSPIPERWPRGIPCLMVFKAAETSSRTDRDTLPPVQLSA